MTEGRASALKAAATAGALSMKQAAVVQAQWRCSKYSIQLMCAPSLAFTLAWRDMDSLFDRLHEWRDAPIDLRHPFCFYYAHVVSFAKIKMLPVRHNIGTRWQPSARPAPLWHLVDSMSQNHVPSFLPALRHCSCTCCYH